MTTFEKNNIVAEALGSRIEPVACYIRVSHQEQKMHGISLSAQAEKLQSYADANNMKIVEWYKDEGVSARKLIKKRPELQRMIQDAQKGLFSRIIFIKLDRYFRSVAEFHECQKILDEVNVTWTATEEKYDMSTANGRAFVNMKLTIAELEADQGGERVKLVNEYKVKSGLPLFGTTSMPFCFQVAEPKHGERNKYVEKRDREIMEDLIAHVMVNQSISAAVGYINNKYGRGLRYNAVRDALKNEMICGSYRGNPNYCPAYITREMFEKLQKIIERNPRTTTTEYAYIFTGLIKCPECGNRLTGSMHCTKSSSGKMHRYYAYRCNNNRKNKICTFNKIAFENRFEKMMLEKIEPEIERQKKRNFKIAAKQQRVSKYNVAELQAELDRLNYSWQKGRIKTVEEYDKRYDALQAQIEAAHAEHAAAEEAPDLERLNDVLVAGWKEIYKELDNDHKRAFWRSFVEEIEIAWTTERKEIVDIKFF